MDTQIIVSKDLDAGIAADLHEASLKPGDIMPIKMSAGLRLELVERAVKRIEQQVADLQLLLTKGTV